MSRVTYSSEQYDALINRTTEAKPRRQTPAEIQQKLALEKIQSETRAAQSSTVLTTSGKNGKKSKYLNKKVYVGEIKFDSIKEANRWKELVVLQNLGEISNLARQINLSLEVNGVKVCGMRPDFGYKNKDGAQIYEDVKGMKWGQAYQLFRVKAKLFRAIFGYDIIEI